MPQHRPPRSAARNGGSAGTTRIETDGPHRIEDPECEAEARYRHLLENLPDAYALHEIVLDGQGVPRDYRFLEVNPAFERILGLNREAVIGKTVLEVLPETEPYWIELYGEVALGGKSIRFEHYFRHFDRRFEVSAFSPRRGWFATLFTDVTGLRKAAADLQESRESLAIAQQLAHIGNWEWDIVHDRSAWSDEIFRIFGLAPQAFTPDRERALSLLHPDDRARVAQKTEQSARAGQPFYDMHRVVRPDGTERVVESRGQVVRDAAGAPVRLVGTMQDVTERIRLLEDVYRLAAIVQSSDDGILGLALDGTIQSWNAGAERLYGYSAAEAVGRPVAMLVPPDRLAAEVPALLERARSGEPVERFETVRVRKDGTPVDVSLTISPIRDAAGGIVGVSGIARDITERKRTEEALRLQAEQYATLLATTPDGYWQFDAEGRLLDVNAAYCRMSGYSRDELLALRVPDIEAVETPEEVACHIRKVMRAGFDRFESRHRKKNGELFDVEISVSYWPPSGQFLLFGRDITARKRAEAERRRLNRTLKASVDHERELARRLQESETNLRTLIERELDGVVVTDRQGAILFANPSAENLLGRPAEVLHGAPLGLPLVTGEVTEVNLVRPDGGHQLAAELRAVETTWSGAPALLVSLHDVTERKRAEAEIRTLNETLERRVAERTAQLEVANRNLESFAYSVSHDLRAPLRAVDGFSRILLEGYSAKFDEEGRRLLRVVRDGAVQMGRMIDDILAFSRAGRLEIRKSEIDMTALARAVAAELRPTAPGRTVKVDIRDLPPAQGDPAMIRQVLANLLANAYKFTQHKERAEIEVGAQTGERETHYYVRDNGAGFDMRYADRLFGVFQRLHTTVQFEGTGIGLAIVRSIVERHGGRVWAEGKVNQGATFHFALPAPPKEVKHD